MCPLNKPPSCAYSILLSITDTIKDDERRIRRKAGQDNALTDEKEVHDEQEQEKDKREEGEDMLGHRTRKLLSKEKTTNAPSSAPLASSSPSPRPSLLSKGSKIPPSLSSTSSPSSSPSSSSTPSSTSSTTSSSSCRCECTKETLQNLTVPHILASTVSQSTTTNNHQP